MSSYIHLLEVVTALMCVVLAMRVHRCYRDFYHAPEPLVLDQMQDVLQEEPITVAEAQEQATAAPIIQEVPVQAVASPSDDILSDYIGEFFADSKASTNIDAYRAPVPETVVAIAEENMPRQSSFDDNIPILEDELDDDSIITVMNETANQEMTNNVMSEKVVHAMLDEAKLVCAS